MVVKNIRFTSAKLIAVTSMIALLSACAGPGAGTVSQAPVSRIDRAQLGDNNLSCQDISDQIIKMDKVLSDAKTSQADADSGVMAASGAGTAGAVGVGSALAFVPFVGGIASAGLGIATGNAANDQAMKGAQAMQDAQDAKERKMTLVSLSNSKGCGNPPTAADQANAAPASATVKGKSK